MIAVARYLLAAHARTRSFVAPGVVFAAGVVLLYSPSPNPVLPTAGTTAAFAFFAQTWLAFGFFTSGSAADRHTLLAAAGTSRVARGRLLGGGALAALVALLAIAYPVAAGRFDHAPDLAELTLCLLATLVATIGATATAAVFAPPVVRNRGLATLGVAGAALLTVPLGPPAVATARAMEAQRAAQVPARLGPDLAATTVLAVVVVIACPALWRRSE